MSNSSSSGIRFNSPVWIGVLLFIGVILGFTLWVVKPEAEIQQETTVQEEKMVDVLVPLQDIRQGTQLQPSMFKVIQKPKELVRERTVRSFEEIEGMYSRAVLFAGSHVTQDFVQKEKILGFVDSMSPAGYRVVTIRTDAPSSVEGWARAGSKVDVNWASTKQGKRCITTIVQCAKMISVEKDSDNNNPDVAVPSTITLLVPKDSISIIHPLVTLATVGTGVRWILSGEGQLSLALRDNDCVVDEKREMSCEDDVLEEGK